MQKPNYKTHLRKYREYLCDQLGQEFLDRTKKLTITKL